MNFFWFIAGIASGFVLYHQAVPWLMRKSGRDKAVLNRMMRGLNHDAFINVREAVRQESERRESKQ